ncbi:uncharacterized protein UTRI_01398_B [Ustilago trichophora]|uniref:SANT domain-containing protein n=1 Tax=Ustilago trichophora TaxID=86804 RepID=A0A5C3E2E7_9BASI|nr:uncharacterized protein UTRI_01398_B [Ustilago trichophora]
MTDPRRNLGDDDDEEEEGMLKVDEEGQIEDDGADQQVSHSRPTTEGRSVSLADRLMPLSDASPKKAGSGAPSSSSNNGYVSPRHTNLERDRERDRYLETSPGPSSYAPQRSRFGYPAETGASYGATSAYPYPPSHREPLRAEPPFASSSRTPVSRAENRRGWYPSSTTPRGPDTYRPGAIRDRERERDRDRDRDWDSFRDGDREREWSALDRDRGERDAYRDLVDKRRDWPPRDRGAAPASYDMADAHPPYPPSASSKYGFDTRDFPARRPASPPAHLSRDREFDADRSRDRDRDRTNDRDQRIRAPSSGWGSGMRQWGKPSDAGWDSRSGRRPASEDARSDTSHRPSGSRSNNTPPPAASSDTGNKPIGSDQASEKSEVRSRDLSPQPARSPERDVASEKVAEHELTKESDVKDKVQESAESVENKQEADAGIKQETGEGLDTKPQSAAMEAELEAKANEVGTSAPTKVDAVETSEPEAIAVQQASETERATEDVSARDASSADQAALSQDAKIKAQASAKPSEPAPTVQHEEPTREPEALQSQSTLEPATLRATSPEAVETEALTATTSSPARSKEEGQVDPSVAEAKVESTESGREHQPEAEVEQSSQVSATRPGSAKDEAVVEEQAADVAPVSAATATSVANIQLGSSESADEPMRGEHETMIQNTSQAEEQAKEAVTSQLIDSTSATVKSEQTSELPTIEADAATIGDATLPDKGNPAPSKGTLPEAGIVDSSDGKDVTANSPVRPIDESNKEIIADVDMPDALPDQVPLLQETSESRTDEAASFAPSAVAITLEKTGQQSQVDSDSLAGAETTQSEPAEPQAMVEDAPATIQTQPSETGTSMETNSLDDTVKSQVSAAVVQVEAEQPASLVLEAPPAPVAVAEKKEPVDAQPSDHPKSAMEPSLTAVVEAEAQAEEVATKVEEGHIAPSIANVTTNAQISKQLDESMEVDQPDHQADQPPAATNADNATTDVAASTAVPGSEPPVLEPETETTGTVSSQIQVSGPYVTAIIDKEKQTQEITLPAVDYGDDKEARALMRQENARIEEVEMPAADQTSPSLRIAEIDDTSKDIEPPLMTPTTKEQLDRAILTAVREHIASGKGLQDEWKRVMRDNQRLSQKTTMEVLKAKIHGIPQIVSSGQPLWLADDDKQTGRVKAQLYDQLLDRKKRLNDKVEGLKKRYRSINEDWKVHCSRLDRAAERREMMRRPPVNTPAGTPGGFGVEDPSSGAASGGLLAASLTTGRANRRSAQAGFAGFGDAVRSEAEFLEILASLENADMQDPNMRAARTTATAPDMYIDPDSDHLMKLRYDDINGFVADPLAFYLDEFDPDVWSEEEKAIFARRYALWPKQFGKIAQALPHKTPAQCVRYYYLNKKAPGNDFKALAAARNRERKRKARVKPKKAKGSALMADLKSAKGEEVDDIEDGSGIRSPMDATDPSLTMPDAPVPSNGRRGGRSRMVPAPVDGGSGLTAEEVSAGRKRPADQNESEVNSGEVKASDKRRSGPKSKRAKSDSASATDKARKPRTSLKKDIAALEEAKAGVPPIPTAGPKQEDREVLASSGAAPGTGFPESIAAPSEAKARLEDSDLAAAEALGALAGLFGGPVPGDANASNAAASQGLPGSDAASLQHLTQEVDADGRKVGKKRRSKTAAPGEEGGEGTGKGRGKQPTSSYWSVAERSEFLRALVVHGPRWEVVSSTLAQKSAAQARNYFARNENEVDFAEAAALARSHAQLPQAEREAVALAFVRQRFASNASTAVSSMPMHLTGGAMAISGMPPSSLGGDAVPRTTHLPPPPGISASQTDITDVKMREQSPEPPVQRRGLQINSLLNDTNEAASSRTKRRSSLHEWQAEREEPSHVGVSRDTSVPPVLYTRQVADLERRPVTADRMEAARPLSSDGRAMRDDHDERTRAYERLDAHRPAADGRDLREGAVEPRSWMYDSPYEAHHRPSPSPGYAPMAPPSHPVERGMPSSRYPMPPGSVSVAGHMARPVSSLSSHLHPSEEAEAERERERAGYAMYGGSGRSREHESHSMPPTVPDELRHAGSGEQLSPTSGSFGASHGYSRYAPPGVASLYPSTAAASTALASRGRPTNGPLTAPLPSTSDRPAYEQRWQRYSQSPGPSSSSTPSASAGHGASGVGGFSTGSAYRSSNSPYSSFPSQSLPRPSLPSLSASAAKVGAPHLPSLGAAGRSLPPILGTFSAPGRSMGPGSRPAGTGEEARYWPYPHRPRGHDQPSNRNPE